MAGEDWWRLADYVIARRVELGMRDRRAFAEASGVTERTLGKLENGQSVSPSTLGMVENRLGWAPGSCRRILAGGEPSLGSQDLGQGRERGPDAVPPREHPGSASRRGSRPRRPGPELATGRGRHRRAGPAGLFTGNRPRYRERAAH
jgi:hypothetical protein